MAGYNAHKKRKEEACEACGKAKNEYSSNKFASEKRARKEKLKKLYPLACMRPTAKNPNGTTGTRAGARAHRRYGEELCEECLKGEVRDAHKLYLEIYKKSSEEYKRRAAKRKAIKRNLPFEKYSISGIISEHGDICYLCNEKVDVTLPPLLPFSPEIDHVHPLSRQGCPGDVISNVRITHRRCNRSKSDRLISEMSLPLKSPVVEFL